MQTVRLTCVEWLQKLLATTGQPTNNVPEDLFPYTVKFSAVELGPLGDADTRKLHSAGILPGRERKKTLYPLDDCWLPISIEFRQTINRGDAASGIEIERVLGEVQTRIHADTTLGGNALDLRELGNEIDIESYADRTVRGVIMIEINYRHQTGKPHEPV